MKWSDNPTKNTRESPGHLWFLNQQMIYSFKNIINQKQKT